MGSRARATIPWLSSSAEQWPAGDARSRDLSPLCPGKEERDAWPRAGLGNQGASGCGAGRGGAGSTATKLWAQYPSRSSQRLCKWGCWRVRPGQRGAQRETEARIEREELLPRVRVLLRRVGTLGTAARVLRLGGAAGRLLRETGRSLSSCWESCFPCRGVLGSAGN